MSGRYGTGRRSETFAALSWSARSSAGGSIALDWSRPVTDDQLRRLARAILAACLLLALVGAGTSATLHMVEGRSATPVPAQLPLPRPVRLPADAITVVAPSDERAAPASGVTGTTALPALPVTPALADRIVAGESGVVPARPFASGDAPLVDRGRALQCLTAAVYYEAGAEPDAGRQAVAQVVLNRVRHPAFPASVCGVVYQGSEHAGCQFSFACDGSLARAPSRDGWARAARVAAAALAGRVFAPVGLATHYHTYAVTPAWNRALVMTDVVGAHFFHRWKGYWGTAAAFSQRYRGGEPLPGPHSAEPSPLAPSAAVAAMAATVPFPTRPTTTVPVTTAAHDGGTPVLPGKARIVDDADDQILPQWRDSGKPLQP